MQILGGVGQVMEVAERAHDVGRVRRAEPADRPLQVLQAGRIVLLAVVDRRAADALDQIEDLGAGLLADGVAEQPPEEPDVLAQLAVLFSTHRLPARGYIRRRRASCFQTCGMGFLAV